MGRQKIDPWISTIVLIKVFENVTNNNTDLITVSIAFLFFIWVIISPDEHPRFCSTSSTGFFSCPVVFIFSWNSLYQQVQIPFGGPPFLKKSPLKLQKGAHLTLIGQFLE